MGVVFRAWPDRLEWVGRPFGPLGGCPGAPPSERCLLARRLLGVAEAVYDDSVGEGKLGQCDLEVIEQLPAASTPPCGARHRTSVA